MKIGFKGIFISALIFCVFIGISESAPHVFVDLNSATAPIDSFYAPAKDSTFIASFYVYNIQDLNSYQFYVQFDTTKLRYISSAKTTSTAPHLMETNGQSVNFQSKKSIERNDRILMAGYYLGQIPGASGSGYLGLITFQKLTLDSAAVIIAEPIFLKSSEIQIDTCLLHGGLILPPGSISVHKKRNNPANYNIQISNRTVHLSFPVSSPVQIRLLDISGRSIYQKSNASQHFSFNLPNTGSGVFMLCISDKLESFVYPVVLK